MKTRDSHLSEPPFDVLEDIDARVDACANETDDVFASRFANLEQDELAEARLLWALHGELRGMKVAVADDFADGVMARLGLEDASRSSLPSWLLAAAAALLLSIASVVLFGGVAGSAAASAVWDMALTTVAAGAGLVGASWKGVGTIATSWLETSPLTFGAAALAFVASQVLLVRRWRRSRVSAKRQ